MKKHSLILALALVVNMAGCAGNMDTKPEPHKEDISITFTAPSDENGPVTPGHSFFISGSITNDEALSALAADYIRSAEVSEETLRQVRKNPGT